MTAAPPHRAITNTGSAAVGFAVGVSATAARATMIMIAAGVAVHHLEACSSRAAWRAQPVSTTTTASRAAAPAAETLHPCLRPDPHPHLSLAQLRCHHQAQH